MKPTLRSVMAVLALQGYVASTAYADSIDVKALSPEARCRDEHGNFMSPRLRPVTPFRAERNPNTGAIVTTIGEKRCFLDISDIDNGPTQPCSIAGVTHPAGTVTAGVRGPLGEPPSCTE